MWTSHGNRQTTGHGSWLLGLWVNRQGRTQPQPQFQFHFIKSLERWSREMGMQQQTPFTHTDILTDLRWPRYALHLGSKLAGSLKRITFILEAP